MTRSLVIPLLALSLPALAAGPAADSLKARVDAVVAPLSAVAPGLEELYLDLHRHPELSFQEKETARKLAARLKEAGFEVTEGVGGNGVVGILRNGDGPVVMLRTDLDALPVKETTGVPYASAVVAKDDSGAAVPVMHACGHDLHMSVWTGAATLLARGKSRWRGTLMVIGQPAEERGSGAQKMLDDGLFTRFPKPSFALALHDTNDLPAGKAGVTPGYALANVDSVDVTIHGRGGHGAAPQFTVDPIVLGAKIVLALQTLVSRERSPFDPAVVTVGAFQAGTKHNIIPSEATLKITVRSYSDEVRQRLLDGIRRITAGEAIASGAPAAPDVVLSEPTPSVYNDPVLTGRVKGALAAVLGPANVVDVPPATFSEDFALYGRAGVPATIFWLGAADPKALAEAKAAGRTLPPLHSGEFVPDYAPAIRTGVTSMVAAALEVLGKP